MPLNFKKQHLESSPLCPVHILLTYSKPVKEVTMVGSFDSEAASFIDVRHSYIPVNVSKISRTFAQKLSE